MRPDGVLILAIGVSRSGKSVFLKSSIERDERVLAFDPNGEYAAQLGFTPATSRADLFKLLVDAKAGAHIAYLQSDKKEFDYFCDCAFNWNRQAQATVVCEELANVTDCGKASGSWGRLVSQGLKFGPKVICTVQRGQEVDKSVMNNASFLHIARHNTEHDRDYMAKKLGCDASEIPKVPLEFIQWSSDRGIVVSGDIDFQKSRPNDIWKKGVPRFRQRGKGRRLLTIGESCKFKQVQYA